MLKALNILIGVSLLTLVVKCQQNNDAGEFCRGCQNRRNHKDLYANPNDCHTYFQCFYFNETLAIGFLRNCPAGLFWHDEHLQCVPEGDTPCFDVCRNVDTASYGCYADPAGTCSKYFVCANAVSYGFCCPPNTRFDADECICVEDELCKDTCALPPAPTTTPRPTPTYNSTICQDSFGNYLRPVANRPLEFQLVDPENPGTDRTMTCGPGTSFTLSSCACDRTVAAPRHSDRQCSLYLPFDSDSKDKSNMRAYTALFDSARVTFDTKARGVGSLRLNGGRLEVPIFKNLDMSRGASFCFFYRCGLSFANSTACVETAGLVSNNKDSDMSEFSVILATKPGGNVDAHVNYKEPDEKSFSSGKIGSSSDFHQVCLIHDGFMVDLYIDNELVSSVEGGELLTTTHCPLTFGTDQFYGDFHGYMDEILVCGFAMDASDVASHYQGANGLADAGLIPSKNRLPDTNVPQYGDADSEWEVWCEEYQVQCSDQQAKAIFTNNLEKIKQHNERYLQGREKAPQVLNKFSATSLDERKSMLGLKLPDNYKERLAQAATLLQTGDCDASLPESFDARDETPNAVHPPVDQGTCGSCYAFATTAVLEYQACSYCQMCESLSVQELVCKTQSTGNYACFGGLMTYCYDYLASLPEGGGIPTESCYPYLQQTSTTLSCVDPPAECELHGRVFNYIDVKPEGDECSLQQEVYYSGVVAIGMECLPEFLDHDCTHVYETSNCDDPAMLNHAMAVIGYGTTESGIKYWIVKNSWGPNWCEGGFIRVRRQDSVNPNCCGVANLASSAILSDCGNGDYDYYGGDNTSILVLGNSRTGRADDRRRIRLQRRRGGN